MLSKQTYYIELSARKARGQASQVESVEHNWSYQRVVDSQI